MSNDMPPEGWTERSLRDVILGKPQYGLTARSSTDEGEVVYLRISDISEDGALKTSNLHFVDADPLETAKYELHDNDFLVARSGSVGRPYLHKNIGKRVVFASYLIRFKLNTTLVVPEYVFYWALSPRFRLEIEARRKVVAQPNVNAQDYCRFRIPLPPLGTQRRIAAILEGAQRLRGKRVRASELTNRVVKSVFLRMFGDPRSNSMKWRTRRIRDFCEMGTGGTPRRSNASYFGGTIPWVKSGEVNHRYIHDTQETLTQDGFDNSNARFFPANTVLVAMYGATAGKVALLKIRATTNQAICGLLPNAEIAHYSYLQHCLEYLAPELTSRTVGTGQPNLSQEIVGNLEMPTPPLDLQKRFATIIEELTRFQERQEQSAREIDGLFASLIERAFNGELRLTRNLCSNS